MSLKKSPSSLFSLCLQSVCQALLQQWKNTYYTNFIGFSEELKNNIGIIIPFTIYDQVFDLLIDSHARFIQNKTTGRLDVPSIPALIDSIIIPNLRKLNLNCLRHMGEVKDEEIRYLDSILNKELPNLNNLVEISLQTSGTDFTLPICTDEILEKIGSSCSKLKSLDVSYNHTVTDNGLHCLLPNESQDGCPLLVKVSLFECSVTPEGIVVLLKGLQWLKFLGYRETGQSLLILNRKIKSYPAKPLELAHVNNLGISSRTCKDLYKLKCNCKLASVLSSLSPKLNGLKVRVEDEDVKFLNQLTSVSILELVFNLGAPSSPGLFTMNYLQLCGTQLVSLSLICDMFSTHLLKAVCENCINLKRLCIKCNKFFSDTDITKSDKKKCELTKLEIVYFRIGCLGSELCSIPHSVFNYVLHKSVVLTEVVLAMKNTLMSDYYIQKLFSSIETSTIEQILILVPYKNTTSSSVNLSMASVDALIGICPQLKFLGNLLVWDVSLEELQEMRRQLKLTNSALVLIYKIAFS